MNFKIIFSFIMIVVVLGLVYLSQQQYAKVIGAAVMSSGPATQVGAYVSDGIAALTQIYPKISDQVQAKGDMVKNNVAQAQKNISQNLGQTISNYVSGVANAVVHPGTPQNCPAVPVSAAN